MWWRKKRRPQVARPLVEALEPRIMYAADLGAGLLAASATEVAGAIEMRVLDAGGDYAVPAIAQDTLTVAAPPAAGVGASRAQQSALPLNFETNAGQADASIDFIARGNGVGIALADGNATLVLKNGAYSDVLRMTLSGAAAAPEGQAEGEVTTRSNYLIGSADQWLTNVANHASVRYDGVYDGIDLRYYGNERALEYDFIVAAGADWRVIALEFEGIDGISIDADGALCLTIDAADGARSLHFTAPVSYQTGPDGREAVASRYVIGDDGRVRFDIGAYDAARTLVIDPLLVYGTYFGGTGADSASAVAVDGAGNAYLTGYTNNAGLVGTLLGLSGGEDVFVTKLSADLSTALYTTYLGGSGNERANAIAVDSSGNAHVTGWTQSAGTLGVGAFPTASPYQGSLNGTQDAFIFKLNAAGNALTYSTFLGGSGNADVGNGIAVDNSGSIYMVGTTTSADFPVSASAVGKTLAGSEAFVAKFNPVSNTLVYSTFIGGGGNETGNAIALDALNRVVIAGSTDSTNLATVGATQAANGGQTDAFVTKLNSAGSAITYSTYFGGNNVDIANAVALRSDGSIVVGGVTYSNDLTISSGALQATRGGGGNGGFVAILDPQTAALTYSTYIGGEGGGSGNEVVTGVAVDTADRIYAVGYTASSSFPVTAAALTGTYGGNIDAFVSLIDPAVSGGAGLFYSSYLGGSGTDYARGMAFAAGTVYVAGDTTSSSGIATSGAQDASYGGGTDAFLAAFSGIDAPVITSDGSGASAAISVAENSTAVTTVTATDADLPAQTLTYSISGGADAGKFTINANTGALGFITAPNFEAPADAGANNVYDLTVQVSDGILTDTQAISITVTNVNDAPSGTNATVTTNEDSAYTFVAADFGFSDTGDSPANTLSAVRISTLPGAGTLTNNGVALSAGQTITLADINLGRLVFTPVANANGNGYASFTFQVQDVVGTACLGLEVDPSAKTLSFSVT